MFEHFTYWIMQKAGYRLYYFDRAFYLGVMLDSYRGWVYRPTSRKGTYREDKRGFKCVGYGVEK